MSVRSVAYKNDNSAYLCFLIMSPDHIFTSFSFPEHNFANVRNILMVLGRNIEQVNAECCMHSAYLHFLIMSPDP